MIGIVRKIKSNRKLKVRNFSFFSIPLRGRGRDFTKNTFWDMEVENPKEILHLNKNDGIRVSQLAKITTLKKNTKG